MMRLINRPSWLWVTFGLLTSIGFAALVVLSVTAWRLELAESEARRAALVEENLRLALWRIDLAFAPLMAQEGIRSVVGFMGTPEEADVEEADAQVQVITRPALGDPPPKSLVILRRFEWSPENENWRGLSQSSHPPSKVDYLSLWERLPSEPTSTLDLVFNGRLKDASDDFDVKSRGVVEFQNRSQSITSNNALVQRLNSQSQRPNADSNSFIAPLVPIWSGGEMLLVRRTQYQGSELLQGLSIDWDSLKAWALASISDLLPNASLEPVEGMQARGGPDMLASLPARLIPGAVATANPGPQFSVPLTLVVAWAGVLLASIVGGMLLFGMKQLSERRAAFVSAVTHELRTPLTTFQLYTEMLSSGMIPDESTRQSYLQTLHAESLRLNHLVDNVLAYARLERGRSPSPSQSLTLESIIEQIEPRLAQVATRGEMRLSIERSEAFDEQVFVNVSVVEQILLNLVDNACKYAAKANDRRIQITATRIKNSVELSVIDHGPGLPPGNKWRRPFSKSAQDAAESSPGIGLGLMLSRRLAKQIGGSLSHDETSSSCGVRFILRLPVIPSSQVSRPSLD